MPALNSVAGAIAYGEKPDLPPPILDSASGSADAYVVKYGTNGGAQWAARITTVNGSDIAYGVSTDSSGNVYVVGTYQNTTALVFHANGTTFTTLPNSGNTDVFIVEYSSTGVALWAARIATTGADIGFGIATDSSGNVIVTGSYTGTATAFNADGSAFGTTLANAGGTDIFVVKYNTNGVTQWVTRVSTTVADVGYEVATDSDGNIYLAGTHPATATIYNSDGTTFGTLNNAGSNDALFVKYNSSGTAQWSARVAFASLDIGFAVATDSSGNIYFGGQGSGGAGVALTAYNSDGTTFATTLPNGGAGDSWVVKYNTTGFVQWFARIASVGTDIVYGLATDPSGNVYATGYSAGAPTVYNADGSTFGTISNFGGGDAWLVKYDTSGVAQWAARVGATVTDFGYSVACDSSGNVYFTGQAAASLSVSVGNADSSVFSTLTNVGSNDSFLVKYNSSGVVQWARSIGASGTDIGRSVTVDTNGNVYTCGQFTGSRFSIYGQALSLFSTTQAPASAADGHVIKYNKYGNPDWVAIVSSSSGIDTATDGSGNVYFVGYGIGSVPATVVYNANGSTFASISSVRPLYIVKYNSSGSAQWVARITSDSSPMAIFVASDSAGNVYVTGAYNSTSTNMTFYSSTGSSFATLAASVLGDVFVAKYDSSGIGQWATRISGTGADDTNSIAVDTSGNVYVSGSYTGTATIFNAGGTTFGTLTNAGVTDIYIVKYSSSGSVSWTARIGGAADEYTGAIATDSSGNVYVTGGYTGTVTVFNAGGTTFGTLANAGVIDMFIVKYNSSGTVQWATRIGGTLGEFGSSIKADSAGNVYVTGYVSANAVIFNAGGSTFATIANSGQQDVVVVKYNTNGIAQWVSRIGSSGNEVTNRIATDSYGNVYVRGWFGSTDGVALSIFNSDGSTFANLSGAYTSLVKFDTNGYGQWVQYIRNGELSISTYGGVAVSPFGDCYVGGRTTAGSLLGLYTVDRTPYKFLNVTNGQNGFVVKYSSTLNPLWAARINGTVVNNGVAVDSSGNVIVCGNYSAASSFFNANETSFGTLTNAGSADAFIAKYNSSGTIQWIAKIASTGVDNGNGVAVDSSGNVYVCGYFVNTVTIFNADGSTFGTRAGFTASGDGFVVKYNSSGVAQWASRFGGSTGQDVARGIAVDSSGNVYITGSQASAVSIYDADDTTITTTASTGGIDAFIIKYNTNGAVQWAFRSVGSATGSELGYGIAIDPNGDVLTAGSYSASASVFNLAGGVQTTLTGVGNNDVYITKHTSAGGYSWAARVTSTGNDIGYGLTTDSAGNVIVTGQYTGTLTAYNANGTSFATTISAVGTDTFAVKYNSSGTVQWIARIGVSTTVVTDVGYGVRTDSAGNVYVAGESGGTSAVAVYNANGTQFGSTNSSMTGYGTETFLIKYNSSGAAQTVSNMGGIGNDGARAIDIDSSGNIYVAGYFNASALVPASS